MRFDLSHRLKAYRPFILSSSFGTSLLVWTILVRLGVPDFLPWFIFIWLLLTPAAALLMALLLMIRLIAGRFRTMPNPLIGWSGLVSGSFVFSGLCLLLAKGDHTDDRIRLALFRPILDREVARLPGLLGERFFFWDWGEQKAVTLSQCEVLVYDESGQIDSTPSRRSPTWIARCSQSKPPFDCSSEQLVDTLSGHYYLIHHVPANVTHVFPLDKIDPTPEGIALMHRAMDWEANNPCRNESELQHFRLSDK